MDAGEVSGPEVQPGAWTACLGLDAGSSWCWDRRQEREFLSPAFPWPKLGLRIGGVLGRISPAALPPAFIIQVETR